MYLPNTPHLYWENTTLILGKHHTYIGKLRDNSLRDKGVNSLEIVELLEGGCSILALSTPLSETKEC